MCSKPRKPDKVVMPAAPPAPPIPKTPQPPKQQSIQQQQQPLQAQAAKPSLTIGGNRKSDSRRARRGAGAISSAAAINSGSDSGGVNI